MAERRPVEDGVTVTMKRKQKIGRITRPSLINRVAIRIFRHHLLNSGTPLAQVWLDGGKAESHSYFLRNMSFN